ncbi:3'-5' exonuclease [Coemansia sp. Benny D115]|nr:3'-5' exonuclease [Coemansia sp. Benny D115]
MKKQPDTHSGLADLDDGPQDKVISITGLSKKRKSRRQNTDESDNIVDAILGDDSRKASKKKKKKSKSASEKALKALADQHELEYEDKDIEYNDDDVADLYAWDSDDEKQSEKTNNAPDNNDSACSNGNKADVVETNDNVDETEANDEALRKAERERMLRLALFAADENETHGASDMPRNESEWFDKLEQERSRGKRGAASTGGKKKSDEKPGGEAEEDGEDGDLPTDLVRATPSAGSAGSRSGTARAAVSVPKEKREAVGKFLAIDCEMVGAGFKGSRAMLARVSIVNYYGHVVLDTFVKPTEPVTDYRTWVSGVRKSDLAKGRPFGEVQQQVADLIKDRVLIGHAIGNDLGALLLTHPPLLIRDTSRYKEFRKLNNGSAPGLRKLAAKVLNINIQDGEHSSVIDAKTTMLLYRSVKDQWEREMAPRRYKTEVVKAKTKERFAQLRREIDETRRKQDAEFRKMNERFME